MATESTGKTNVRHKYYYLSANTLKLRLVSKTVKRRTQTRTQEHSLSK